jgi:hypothetical protein
MSALHSLRKLIRTLTSSELLLCEQYLKTFDHRGEKYESKAVKLFRLFQQPDELKEQELEFVIYGKRNVAAFSRLVLRLKEKVLEAVLLPANTQRQQKLSRYHKSLSEVRLRLSQIDFLLEGELTDMALFRLLTVCETASRFEFFAELLQAYSYRATLEIREQTQVRKQMQKARLCWQYAVTCHEFYLLTLLATPAETELQLTELRKLEQGNGSARAAFLLLEAEAVIATKKRLLAKAVLLRRKQLRLIEQHPALQDGHKLPEVYLALAELNFRLLRLVQAADCIYACLPLVTNDTVKRRTLLELETAVCFLQHNTVAAHAAITEALTLQPTGKTHYLRALVLFQQDEYAQAITVMERINWKAADREGFGTAARVFMQILTIECGSDPEQRSTLRRLKRLDDKMPMAVNLNAREQLIVDLMQALISRKLHFKTVYQEFREHIEQLRAPIGKAEESVGVTAWNVDRWELVVFQEWFVCKVIGVKYRA